MPPQAPATFVPHDVLHHPKRSGGGVVWRHGARGPEVLLVHRAGRPESDWSFPKGRLAPGETAAEAAVREVFEETGHRVQRGMLLGSVVRPSRRGRTKIASYWMMRATGGRFRPNREVDRLAWVGLDEVEVLLAGRPETALLPAIREALREDLAATG